MIKLNHNMLQIQKLKARYDGMEVLHGVDFELNSSEIVAIISPNGAVKSTLLKSIFNLSKRHEKILKWVCYNGGSRVA